MRLQALATFGLFWMLSLSAGCATPQNPTFALSPREARDALDEMSEHPKPLARPLVVLGGFVDPGLTAIQLTHRFREITGDRRIIGVSFPLAGSFADCRRTVIEEVERAFPSDDPTSTTEVDVVAVSMGGLVARFAAADSVDAGGKRLRIARLFTISSPHRGAELAELPTLHRLQLDMRPGSPFLRSLDESSATYELVPYVVLNDRIVGQSNAAPHGETPVWVPGHFGAHIGAHRDARILADIARRLRGEEPFATDPPAPLPERG